MSRRDTIIIAVLINTGLLAALFMMAVHTESPIIAPKDQEVIAELQPAVQKNEITEDAPKEAFEVKSAPEYVSTRDEIDEVLKNYSLSNSAAAVNHEQSTPHKTPVKKEALNKPSSSPRQGEFVEVKVKKGDYLEKIAKTNGTTVGAIQRANHLTSARIDVGQVLLIPIEKQKATDAGKKRAEAKPSFSEPEYYTIKSGDNPWKIAKQFNVRFEELLLLNDLDEAKARNLKPGDVLRVK